MYVPQNLLTPEQIADQCDFIQKYCEAEYPADVPAAVVERAQYLEQYMAVTGKMLADARYHVATQLNGKFMDAVKEANQGRLAVSTLNKYIDSVCRDLQYLVDWVERLNRTCTHLHEMCRSLISKHKAEYQANQYSSR